jgi:glycosyltransferase involved in cell wall biosynthesis
MTGAPLRVLLVNKNAQGGGAERVAMSLHEGLRRRGHRSWLAVANPNDAPDVVAIPKDRPPLVVRAAAVGAGRLVAAAGRAVPRGRRIRIFLGDAAKSPRNAIAEWRGREPFDYPGSRRLLDLPPEMPQLIHAHNLHSHYFDARALAPLSRTLPVALTLHDEWTYTGHCAYTRGLETWRAGCRHCPDRDVYPAIRRDATHANWEAKRRIYADSRLYVTAPSRWLLDRARQSILAEGAVDWRLIPNGVNMSVFQAGDQRAARALLGLPGEGRILLFTAHRAASNPFKDVETVFEAARRIAAASSQPLLMLALGDDGPSETIGSCELRFVAYEPDQERLAAYYRAADIYLHAARADNLPTSILEALASGVPVVATAVGGIPEEIRGLAGAPGSWAGDTTGQDTATGVLVPQGDAGAMAAAAGHLLADDALRARLGENGARDAAERFDFEDQLDATIAWYRDVMGDWAAARASGARRPGVA